MARSGADRARVLLASIRILNGTAALVAPSVLTRRAGAEPSSAATYAFRMFGIRTVLIGLDLLSGDDGIRRHAVRKAWLIHMTDVTTAATLTLGKKVEPRVGAMLTAISGVNVLLSLKARRGTE